MGNKMCKKKSDTEDNNVKSSNSTFDRIFTRLHLKPTTWKSDTHLNKKQVSRQDSKKSRDKMNNTPGKRPLSKSTDWTTVPLEVPEHENNQIKNVKLSFIFNDKEPPTPPPRKNKKGFREKIEKVARSSVQAMQNKKPVEEPLFNKKIINQSCPLDEHDCAVHNRNHKHEKIEKINSEKLSQKENNKDNKLNKRKKNLSVVSLPNYNELKLVVAHGHFDDIDKKPDALAIHNSMTSLPHEARKLTHTSSAGKLENYMTRCRSIGSLLPQQFRGKLRTHKKPADVESDDSFGGLEDWDLKILEHYNPRDASLPRPSRPKKTDQQVLSDLESLIVQEEPERPVPPARRSESPIKRMNKRKSEAVKKRKEDMSNESNVVIITPPSSPILKADKELPPPINYEKLPREEDDQIEHSSLMKILQEYSVKDKQKSKINGDKDVENIIDFIDASSSSAKSSKHSSLTPSLVEYDNKLSCVEDFLNAEKQRITLDAVPKYVDPQRSKT